MKVFALKGKDSFNFICVSKTLEGFKNKMDNAYQNWKGLQSKGNSTSMVLRKAMRWG